MKDKSVARLYWRVTKGFRKAYIFGAAALLLVDLLDLLPPLIVGRLIDTVAKRAGDISLTPLALALLFMGVILFQNLFRYPMRRFFMGTAAEAAASLRRAFAARLLTLSPGFYASQSTGDLMSRASEDVDAVERATGLGLLILIDAAYYLSTIPLIMAFLNPALALYAFCLLPLVPVLVYFGSRIIDRTFTRVQELMGAMTAKAEENAAGVQHIRAFGAEAAQIAAFQEASASYVSRRLGLARYEAISWPAYHLFLVIGMFAVLSFGGWKTIQGEITVGQLVTFIHYMYMLTWPLMALGWTITLFQRGRAALRRILAVVDAPADQVDGATLDQADGTLEVRRLTWSRPGAAIPAINDVSIKVEKGECLAIVGPVGSGKSTLVHLITRMVDPPPGTVLLDGCDVRDVRLSDLRRQIAVAPQDPFLFNGTIRENILPGAPRLQAQDTQSAADEACLLNSEFPDGLETVVGEKGVKLSGGQKQRIALARALIRDAPILILDDALSSVDSETEREIMKKLRNGKNRILIMISHRISAAETADRVAVLSEDGGLDEIGTHAELLKGAGPYAALAKFRSFQEALNGR